MSPICISIVPKNYVNILCMDRRAHKLWQMFCISCVYEIMNRKWIYVTFTCDKDTFYDKHTKVVQVQGWRLRWMFSFMHSVSRRHFIINIKFIWLKRNILTWSTDDNNTRRSLTHWSMQLNWSMEDESCYLLFFVLTLHDIILVENLAMNRHKNIVYCWKMKWFINKLQISFMISHHWIVSLFRITFSLKMCKLNVFL